MSFKNVIYRNLAAEMARKCMTMKAIASVLKISGTSASNKLRGISDFTITEAFKIRDELFPILTVDYLFDTRIRYDMIDVFNFPGKQANEESLKRTHNDSDDPDDCA